MQKLKSNQNQNASFTSFGVGWCTAYSVIFCASRPKLCDAQMTHSMVHGSALQLQITSDRARARTASAWTGGITQASGDCIVSAPGL